MKLSANGVASLGRTTPINSGAEGLDLATSVFYLPTALLPNTFDRDGICCQRPTIVKRCGSDSRVGPK
jgi:hypothetical protein